MTELLEIWADLGLYISIILGAVLILSIFLHIRKDRVKETPLEKKFRVALSNEQKQEYDKSQKHKEELIPPLQSILSKEEEFLQKAINEPNIEVEGTLTAHGKDWKIKKKNTQPFQAFKPMSEEELEDKEKHYQQKMKQLIKDSKPPHQNGKNKEEEEEPETPEGGWETYLENEGLVDNGN